MFKKKSIYLSNDEVVYETDEEDMTTEDMTTYDLTLIMLNTCSVCKKHPLDCKKCEKCGWYSCKKCTCK